MRIKIEKGRASGKINAPPSKSMAHRLLICAALSEGTSIIRGLSECDDVFATLDCLEALGVGVSFSGSSATVRGIDVREVVPTSSLFVRESGSTVRFLMPLLALCDRTTVIYGSEGLMRRPMSVYEKLFSEKGVYYKNDGESIIIKGRLTGGEYSVVGNVSSQFISGLLFALPLCESDSIIKITPPLESRSYINLTISALNAFSVKAEWTDEHTIFIKGNQKYKACDVTVEGDYSGAAFTDAFNLFGGDVEVMGLNPESIQGDAVYRKFYPMLSIGMPSIHLGDCPDLGPILFAIAAAKSGGVFSGTRRLKIKESDRASAMAEELKKFGTAISVYEDTVTVYPADFHAPTEPLYGHNDHRIVMALSVLLTLVSGEIIGAEAVAKSYPEFFNDLKRLGISYTVEEN